MATDNSHKTYDQKRDKVRAIVNSIRSAFMVTHGRDGSLHGRPMATAELQEGWDRLYFASHRESGKTAELAADQRVYLGYVNATGSEWVSLSGTARILDDRQKIKQLYSPNWNNWFDGPDDPNLVLIEATPERAEYWDNGSQVLEIARQAVAAVTGKKMGDGENAKVELGATTR